MLLDGKTTSLNIQNELAEAVELRAEQGKKRPHLAAILVGDHPASRAYVGNKVKACDRIGFESTLVELPDSVTEAALIAEVESLNNRADVDGFIVQLPLPDHINEQRVIEAISPEKDVDGFHPVNVGRMTLGLPGFLPATPAGILELLRRGGIETTGKHVVVIGRSAIVGTPVSILLSRPGEPGNATVTLCHSRTHDLPAITRQADILIAAIGKARFVHADWVKDGAVVIDVGINHEPDATKKSGRRMVGDVDFEAVAPKCSAITPVPGGVGPMTIAALLQNTMRAAQRRD
jgi:methylenetetrahydrofolate dehydrogenase (NADP+)/methenyltetrahydrofolate cyclohydrolase